jgi:hypothetical protein
MPLSSSPPSSSSSSSSSFSCFCGLHFGYQSDKEQLIKYFILLGGERASLVLALPALEEGRA